MVTYDRDSTITVLVGLVAALRVNASALREDVRTVADILTVNANASLHSSLPRSTGWEPDWSIAAREELSPQSLVQALGHPSNYVRVLAIELLWHGAGGAAVPSLNAALLTGGPEQAIRGAAAVSLKLLPETGLDLLVEYLSRRPISAAAAGVVDALSYHAHANDDGRVRGALARCLSSAEPGVALAVVRALEHMPTIRSSLGRELRHALTWWGRAGVRCARGHRPTREEACSECHLSVASPRAPIVSALVVSNAIDTRWLVRLASNRRQDIADAAIAGLTKTLASHTDDASALVQQVGVGWRPSYLLQAIFGLPLEVLRNLAPELRELAHSSNSNVRSALIKNLANAEWLPVADALATAEQAIADAEPLVREDALETIRALRARAGASAMH